MDCSFKKIVGTPCGADQRYRDQTVKPLSKCKRDISSHCLSVDVNDVNSEVELILARASIFTVRKYLSSLTICQAHRSALGIGCRRVSNRWRVPASISTHKKKKNNGKPIVELPKLRHTGIFVAVGSGKYFF